MPDLITSVGPHKQYPYLTLGDPGGKPRPAATQPSSSKPFLVSKRTPLRSTRVRIAGGDRGIAQTIRYMYGAVMGNEGVHSPEIRRQALKIVELVPSRDQQREIATVLQWVKNNIKFRGEYAETVQTPLVTLQLHAGDCDDQATLIAALLASLGYKTRFSTVAADPSAPWAYSHVFTEVFQRRTGQWISVDSTVPQSVPGWKPPRVFRAQAWRAMGSLADDATTTTVPGGATATGPISKSQFAFQLLKPISDALGQRIAYGANPPRSANLNLGLNTTSLTSGGIPPIAVYTGGAIALGVIVWLSVRGGRG